MARAIYYLKAHTSNIYIKDGVYIMPTMFKFRDCLASEVKSQPIINGSFIVCRDTGDMFIDTLEGERMTISKTAHVVSGTIQNVLYPEEGHMYMSSGDKQICVYSNGKFVPLNISTCIKRVTGCYVNKSNSTNVDLSLEGDKLTDAYDGTIVHAITLSLKTDLAISDLDNQLIINNSVTAAQPVRSETGKWTVNITNNNANIPWIGDVDVMLFMVNAYNSNFVS